MKRYAADGVHQRVVEYMATLARKGDVLDVPTGQGALAKDIENLGFRVFAADLSCDNIVYRNGRCLGFNLSDSLPVKDESVDYVLCVEGIEHLENPFDAIGELSRVLRRNGLLIITTPNIMTVKSRLRFLIYSHFDHFRYFGPLPAEAKHRADGYEHRHVTPVSYPQMKYMLEKNGLTLQGIEASRRVRKWPVLHSFLKPLIRRKTRRYYRDPFYVSDTLLEGEVLVFVARKQTSIIR
jgi:ubiquinone/menaquinone biosynthesis C-methylase UbiE